MTTKVSGVVNQPAVLMDSVHIDRFVFEQKRVQSPVRAISVGFCMYGFDENGNKVYEEKSRTVIDPNMDNTIVKAAIAAGQTVEEFMADYTYQKSAITSEYLNGAISDAELMAYFELAMARVMELDGKIDISGIE